MEARRGRDFGLSEAIVGVAVRDKDPRGANLDKIARFAHTRREQLKIVYIVIFTIKKINEMLKAGIV